MTLAAADLSHAGLGLALALASAFPAAAAGVPTVDAKAAILNGAGVAVEREDTATAMLETERRGTLSGLHADQVAALDQTLDMLTGASHVSGDLETLAGTEAPDTYPIEDDSPYAARLFGDASTTIEQMIADTAVAFGGHPALAAAGINPTEFRCWFQALVKQESGFSIGARSPKAAFGLTQIIPGTAKDLGIFPAYYDDPRLQLAGGARYLLTQLGKFGSMPLALAAYNAGPGAVSKYGGIPPYAETQDYVVKISRYYNRYAARVTGADSLGTLDPRDLAIAEASNTADAGLHYGMHSAETLRTSLTRVKGIVARIPATRSVKEAYDLNTYARAELARIAVTLQRLKAARVKVEQARSALLLEAYARDVYFLKVLE